MTSPGTDYPALSAIIARTRYLLLDFDGPICSIYAGLPASTVAEKLRKLLPADMPDEVKNTRDPIEVFCYSATVSTELAARVEAEMTDLEVTAAATAEPTPYIHEVITSAHESGRTIAVVSNNSPRAVGPYLDRHGLSDSIALIVGRNSPDPALLKPSPDLLDKAIRDLSADPIRSAFVGDSLTDIEAAHSAAIASIGYANRPGKRESMTQARAGAVIASMADLARSLRSRGVTD